MQQAQTEMIMIEVAYALPHRQSIIPFKVLKGTTALQAIMQSGILQIYTDISVNKITLGIFGKKVTHDTVVQPGDRVEIYRALLANPKEARRQRAAAKNGKIHSK